MEGAPLQHLPTLSVKNPSPQISQSRGLGGRWESLPGDLHIQVPNTSLPSTHFPGKQTSESPGPLPKEGEINSPLARRGSEVQTPSPLQS